MPRKSRGRTSGVIGPGHSEHQQQKALVTWTRDSARFEILTRDQRDALTWFHSIPNAAIGRKPFKNKRALAAEAAGLKPNPKDVFAGLYVLRMLDEGLTKGVLDLRLDYVRRDADGMIIAPGLIGEMKKPDEDLRPEQKSYAEFARRQGYQVFTWYDWTRGAIDIASYMQLERFAPVYFEVEPKVFRTIQTYEQILRFAL